MPTQGQDPSHQAAPAASTHHTPACLPRLRYRAPHMRAAQASAHRLEVDHRRGMGPPTPFGSPSRRVAALLPLRLPTRLPARLAVLLQLLPPCLPALLLLLLLLLLAMQHLPPLMRGCLACALPPPLGLVPQPSCCPAPAFARLSLHFQNANEVLDNGEVTQQALLHEWLLLLLLQACCRVGQVACCPRCIPGWVRLTAAEAAAAARPAHLALRQVADEVGQVYIVQVCSHFADGLAGICSRLCVRVRGVCTWARVRGECMCVSVCKRVRIPVKSVIAISCGAWNLLQRF